MLYEDRLKRPSSYLERTEKNMIEVYRRWRRLMWNCSLPNPAITKLEAFAETCIKSA